MFISILILYSMWIKSFHVISVIAWMAGIFYLPRLFVYHTQAENDALGSARFKIMEHKLLYFIMVPAMLMAILTGGLLIMIPGVVDWSSFWWPIKLSCAVAMVLFEFACMKWQNDFYKDENKHSEGFYRFINEIPTLLMIIIVIMVIVKPF